MLVLWPVILRILHFIYSLTITVSSALNRIFHRIPQSLNAKRNRIPGHLAVLLVTDDYLGPEVNESVVMESVEIAVECCRTVGIAVLTVFDSQGILYRRSRDIRERIVNQNDSTDDDSAESDIEYPLTPPLSDDSDELTPATEYPGLDNDLEVVTIQLTGLSERQKAKFSRRKNAVRRRHPSKECNKTPRNPLTLNLVSRDTSKTAIASAACALAHRQTRKSGRKSKHIFNLSVDALNSILEGRRGLSSPDLMIVHPLIPSKYNQTPLELHGFPPWQIRLTEIYHDKHRDRHQAWRSWLPLIVTGYFTVATPLDDSIFRDALDEFAGAEMRMGK